MSLSSEPVVKKFFTNKVESSRDNWYEYLIHIARTFYSIDGQEYKRDTVVDKFSELSPRSVNSDRDASNFRDEFGAYGSFLGIYRLEKVGGQWFVKVSQSAKDFLCRENSNAAAFLRAQLALFQYPNGMGAVVSDSGSVSVQGNVKNDTIRELNNGIKLNPLRLICRTVEALVEIKKISISSIAISYPTLLCMFNDDRLNTEYNPALKTIAAVYGEYTAPDFVLPQSYSDVLTNFKRNFHIVEKTGLFVRDSRFGLMVAQTNYSVAYECIKTIGNIDVHFDAFDHLYGAVVEDDVRNIIAQNSWGKYYDAGNLPGEILAALGSEMHEAPIQGHYEEVMDEKIQFNTGLQSEFARNRILFGAPGTGKSYTINQESRALIGPNNEDDYERVTFHPDYSYANFVGTYKPVPCKDHNGNDAITYEYVPGPFMRVYVKALKNSKSESIRPFLLIIEEINRANVAAVFGDIFQLLDRDDTGVSDYPIQATEDMKKYLAKELGGNPGDYSKIRIPDNMFLWATMNSADQGVFPMDTAFKRRWDFTYLGIDDSDAELRGKYVLLAGDKSQKVEWNKLRKAINHFLAREKINEDKQLGPYFMSRSIIIPTSGDEIDRSKFIRAFKNKVIMYLFEDAAKQKRTKLFEGCAESNARYSEICHEFDVKGIEIFNHDIQVETEAEKYP